MMIRNLEKEPNIICKPDPEDLVESSQSTLTNPPCLIYIYSVLIRPVLTQLLLPYTEAPEIHEVLGPGLERKTVL